VEISAQQLVNPPWEILVSQDVDVTLRKTLHNNGPVGPVSVSISTAASTPAGCAAAPGPANPGSANLPISTDVVIDEVWTIHCSSLSVYQFRFDNSITINTSHVSDPNPANDAASTHLTVHAKGQADVKISAQQLVNPPTEIPVSQDVDVTLRKTLHNNGPFGPVAVSISASGAAPVGCTANPDPANPGSTNLPVSTVVVIDEVWTIRCSNLGPHLFSFDNSIEFMTDLLIDPSTVNNTASTSWSVDVSGPPTSVSLAAAADAHISKDQHRETSRTPEQPDVGAGLRKIKRPILEFEMSGLPAGSKGKSPTQAPCFPQAPGTGGTEYLQCSNPPHVQPGAPLVVSTTPLRSCPEAIAPAGERCLPAAR
jgi:hypothetical protein